MANRESLYSLADKDDAVVLEGTLGYSQLREKHPARSSLIDADVYTIELVDPKLADTKKWGLTTVLIRSWVKTSYVTVPKWLTALT